MSESNQHHKTRILSTREHHQEDVDLFRSRGFQLFSYPMLSFEFPHPDDAQLVGLRTINKTGWVITSKNGARGLLNFLENEPGLPRPEAVVAVGHKTAEALRSLNTEIRVPDLMNARGAARLISKEYAHLSWIHFCGNLKRPELGWELAKREIAYHPVEVYKTQKPEHMPDSLPLADAVLFYSPSAVSVWFEHFPNYINRNQPAVVAIGPSTERALLRHTNQPCHVAGEPEITFMLEAVAKALKE